MKKLVGTIALSCCAVAAQSADITLTVRNQFSSGLGLVGLAHDPGTRLVWGYGGFGASLQSFDRSGVAQAALVRPGESANDADLEVAPKALSLAGTRVPAGTLLMINGETGVAEIYALDRSSGATLATLTTGFGASHVVGGAYHPRRNTFFLVQDKVPGGSAGSLVAEIDPDTGAVLNSFQIGSEFVVNYGDLDISQLTGNLYVVSSDETSIGEFTPTGTFVQKIALPAGVTSLSGIAIDDKRREVWVGGTGGTVWQLGVTLGR